MSRRFVSVLVLLMLILQGAQVGASVLPDLQAQHHCDGHDTEGADCPCCDEGEALGSACAAFCSMPAALPVTSLDFSSASKTTRHSLVVDEAAGPASLPLNPPPIS
jgi:hypothetical protein